MSKSFKDILRKSIGIRICVLFGSFVLLIFLSSLILQIVKDFKIFSSRDELLFASLIQSLFVFGLSAFILGKFVSKRPFKWLSIESLPHLRSFIGVVLVFIMAMPAMDYLIEWNQNLHFPEWMESIESKIRDWENNALLKEKELLNIESIPVLLCVILVVGVCTGFGEEMFFRAGLQKIFIDSNIGKTVSVISAGFIFSFMHLQFFGFIPRMVTGIFFGYLLLWSGSIWLPIFAHALNNSIVILTSYFLGESFSISTLPTGKNEMDLPFMAIGSLVITILFFIYLRDYFFRGSINYSKTWQKRQQVSVSGN